jgi:SAM-dependent methyltransferase
VQNANKRLQFIKKQKDKGTLLEVGFGDGVFLSLATKKFKCTGLDPSAGYKYIYDYLEQKGIEVSDKPLEKYSSKKRFDIVCSFLVLEHIKDPIAFIKLQIKHLSPNGILVVEVPDIRKYGSFNSESVLTYEHVYHYCIESLSFLLSQLNLELVSANNKNVSYGFSLIAAFRLKKKNKPKILINGFGVLKIIQEFIEKRKQYQLQMTAALSDIIKEANDKDQKIALYGTGFLFNYAMECCGLDMNKVELLFDDTKEKLGEVISGKAIKPLIELKNHKPAVMIVFSEMFFEPMKQNVLNTAVHEDLEIVNIHQRSI